MPARSLQVLLAMMLALWSPIWCCCASPRTTDETQNTSLIGHCPNCLPENHQPHEPKSDHGHTCPHASLRTLAQIDKAPQTQAIALSLCFVLSDIDSWRLKPSASSEIACDSPPSSDAGTRTLIALRCQFTI